MCWFFVDRWWNFVPFFLSVFSAEGTGWPSTFHRTLVCGAILGHCFGHCRGYSGPTRQRPNRSWSSSWRRCPTTCPASGSCWTTWNYAGASPTTGACRFLGSRVSRLARLRCLTGRFHFRCRATFFRGQIEERISSRLSSWLARSDLDVFVAVSCTGIYLIEPHKGVRWRSDSDSSSEHRTRCNCCRPFFLGQTALLGLKYGEFIWECALPYRSDDAECFPCIFLQFASAPATARDGHMTHVVQIFTKQVGENFTRLWGQRFSAWHCPWTPLEAAGGHGWETLTQAPPSRFCWPAFLFKLFLAKILGSSRYDNVIVMLWQCAAETFQDLFLVSKLVRGHVYDGSASDWRPCFHAGCYGQRSDEPLHEPKTLVGPKRLKRRGRRHSRRPRLGR